ncbi:MAG TPA: STAS domain-containing protein [Acetobacteraceae bacterium]|nr:STAS domain-containing protein [Acetobacteraceae bacterium]
MQMDVEALDGERARVVLAGRMDVAGTAAVDAALTELSETRQALLIDLARVDFISSIGLRTLLLAAKRLGRRGGRVVLLHPAKDVEKVLWVSGIAELMPIHHDADAALAAVLA